MRKSEIKICYQDRTFVKVYDETAGGICSSNPQCSLYDEEEQNSSELCDCVRHIYERNHDGRFCDDGMYWLEELSEEQPPVEKEYFTKEEVEALFKAQNEVIAQLKIEVMKLSCKPDNTVVVKDTLKTMTYDGDVYITVKSESCLKCTLYSENAGIECLGQPVSTALHAYFGHCTSNNHHYELLKSANV